MQFYPPFEAAVYANEVVMAQATVFWTRRVSDLAGAFDESLKYSGDFEYWLRAASTGFRYKNVREVLAVVIQHETALSTLYADEVQREIELVRGRYSQTFDRNRMRRFGRVRTPGSLALVATATSTQLREEPTFRLARGHSAPEEGRCGDGARDSTTAAPQAASGYLVVLAR